jgi:4-hydroxy-3-methylbut-2-enyl diphosphate reductase
MNFSKDQNLFYLTQTTLSINDIEIIVSALKEKFENIKTLPSSSICYATTNRQKALGRVIDIVDMVLIVGDPTSSNSNRLKEIALRNNIKAFLINTAEEIEPHWIDGVKTIGMTAGASTPEHIVQQCVERLKQMGIEKVEEIVYKKEHVVFPLPKEVLV